MEANDVALPQSIEYVDTICLDKNVILADGCTTATLTTEDGESLPVTFIVSQHIPEDNTNEEPIKEIISEEDCDIAMGASSDDIEAENDCGNVLYLDIKFFIIFNYLFYLYL